MGRDKTPKTPVVPDPKEPPATAARQVSQDELAVIDYLYGHRCVGSDTGKRWEAIERDLGPKISNLEKVLKGLVGDLVGQTKKGDGKYHYYVVLGRVIPILKEHGRWSPSRIKKL